MNNERNNTLVLVRKHQRKYMHSVDRRRKQKLGRFDIVRFDLKFSVVERPDMREF